MKSVHCATTHRAGDPRIFRKEACTLARAGYEVVYVVPHERDEVVDGVRIRAVPVPRNGRERLTRTVWQVARRAWAEGPGAVVHLHDSDLLPVGFALKAAGRRVVYDAHEDTPLQMGYQHWIPRPWRPLAAAGFAALEVAAGRVFDGVIAAEPDNAARFREALLIRNYPIPEELEAPDALPYAARPPVVLYVGTLTRVRGLAEMVRAVQALPAELGVELVLGGSFHPVSLRAEVEGVPRVRIAGYLDRPAVAHWLGRARVGLVVLHPTPKYVAAYPTKLFEYMAAGVPVVASDFPSWRAIVEGERCGLVVDPLDVDAIAGAIRWLLAHPEEAEAMGRRGREAVRARYAWEGEGRRLVAFYRERFGPPLA